MNAQILRVIADAKTCNASCPHCLNHRRKSQPAEDSFDFERFGKACQFALQSGAVWMEIEAKGDPLLGEWTKIYQILSEAGEDFPKIGLTTPGNEILEGKDSFLDLIGWHLTNLTLTIPHHDRKKRKTLLGLDMDYKPLISYLREECQVVVRAACYLSKKGISTTREAIDFIDWCRRTGIQQVAFREIEIPEGEPDEKVQQWCLQNLVELDFSENWDFDDPGHSIFYVNSLLTQNQAKPIYVFPWGETTYDIEGVNVCFEKSEKNYYGRFIKSLVLSDNHLYARWESGGTIIF